jgi:DNA-binding CsgD family transcriptional regulator
MAVALKSDYVPSILEDTDIRSVIRLLGEVAIQEIDLSQKKQRLLSGMCQLIDGDGWAWSLTGPSSTESDAVCLNSLSGGQAAALPAPASTAKLLPAGTGKATLSRKLKRGELAAGNRGLTISACQISDDKMSQLHFGRLKGRTPFSLREEMMTRIFCEEIAWLHDPPVQRVPTKLKLTPRQMATLALLKEGFSHKTIAVQLRLSPNTVHGYIKEIYRYFGIHSHAELLKRIPLSGK